MRMDYWIMVCYEAYHYILKKLGLEKPDFHACLVYLESAAVTEGTVGLSGGARSADSLCWHSTKFSTTAVM